jgi:hypothetical protein
VFLAAGHGTATQEMRDAQATGPRNEIDIFTTRKREHFGLRLKPATIAALRRKPLPAR